MIQYLRILLVSLFVFSYVNAFSQVSFYAATYKGGVTGGGYAPDYSGNGGTGIINVYIEPGSTIRKAYLFAGAEGTPSPFTVTLNSTAVTFNSSNIVSPIFQSPDYGGNSSVNAIDVTSIVSASVTSYSLAVPAISGPSDIYFDFYLFIAYDNASLPSISTEFFVNNKDFAPDVIYNFTLTAPVNSTLPVAVGLDCGYMCGSGDADVVTLNGTNLGTIYGPEANSGSCAGPCANFYYENNTATGLLDNNADQAMNGPDVLSNAQALIPNSSTSFTMEFTHSDADNALWGFFIVSGASCLPPDAVAGPDTALCYGNTVQLNASGGTTYHWSPTLGVSDSTSANPILYATTTTTYSVTVSNGCGSSTSLVDVVVYPAPPTPVITLSNDTLYCSIDPSYSSYQWYYNDTLIQGAISSSYFATQTGNYNVAVKDTNGCFISVGIQIVINGLKDDYPSNRIFVFPNPADKELTIRNEELTTGQVELYNSLGQLCSQSQITHPKSEIQIDVSALPSGMYFIHFTSNDGANDKQWVGKFVKE